ncbi:MAG: peptide ABC transporter substrate-binding protein [Chloroflexota bacterium]
MKKISTFLLLAVLALVAVACSPETVEVEVTRVVTETETVTETVTEEVEVTRVVTETETVTETVVETVTEGARGQGGRVTVIYWQAPSNLNPYLSGGTKEIDTSSVVIEPLALYNEIGELETRLAAEIPTLDNGGVSEDLTQITWTLKEGVLWSDGTPFTSADVVFTYEYCSNPDTGCSASNFYEGIASVEATDDLTVVITFNEPTPFPYQPFVSNQAPIIQQAQFADCVGAAAQECSDQNFGPVGTGPFTVVEFRANDSVLYAANDNYRDANKPFFSELFLKGGGDAAAAARSVLETGEADYAWNLQVEPEILSTMELAGNGKVVSAFATSVERLMINQTNPDPALGDDRSVFMDGENAHPFLTDPVVYQALSMAIDRNILVQTGYGAAGRATCNVIPGPAAFVSTENDSCLTQDIAGANALLDEAGYLDTDGDGIRETPDGIPLIILYQTSTNSVRQGTQAFVKQMWEQIGVETELRNIDASVFFGGDPASPDTYGKFYADIEMYTSSASGLDFQSYLGNWTSSQVSGPDNNFLGSNVARWTNAEFDALHAELATTGDQERRSEIVKELNDLVIQGGGMIPLIYRGSVSAHANTLLGVRMNPWDSELWNVADWTRAGN